MNNTNHRLLAWTVAAACAGMATSSHAGGFQLTEQNASGLGNAYAGQGASAQDASTLFFNPAGMTKLPGKNAVGALNAIRPSAKFTNNGSTNAPLQPTPGGSGGDAGDLAFVPSAYLSWQLSPQFFAGVGIGAPFGLKTEYDTNFVGRFHAIESELKTININPSVAYKVSDMLSIGAGVNYQRADATLSNAVNYSAAAFGAGGAPALAAVGGPGRQGIATVEGNDTGWGYNLGAMIDLNPQTRIGLAYRSSVKYTLEGSVAFSDRPALLAAGLPDGPVRADVELPATASLSLFHRVNPRWDVLADVGWTDWSVLKSLDVRRGSGALLSTTPLNWKDTWRAGFGANYHHNDQWTLRFGVAYDQSPVEAADRSPRVPDQDRKWVAVGAQYRVSRQLALDIGYAHLFVSDSGVNLCNGAQAAANPAACAGKNNIAGTFNNKVNILAAQVRYSF